MNEDLKSVNHVENQLTIKLRAIVFFTVTIYTMTTTFVFSFLPHMVKSFGVSEVETGYYAGIIGSAVYVGRFLCSMLWGYLIDVKGKKLCSIVTQSCLCLTTIVFGFSRNIYWAGITRVLQGCTMGQYIVANAMMANACDSTNMAIGISTVITSYSIGFTLGPSLGGFLVFPNQLYPKIFSRVRLFADYPILLPVIVLAVGQLAGIVLTMVSIKDDRRKVRRSESCKDNPSLASSCQPESINKHQLSFKRNDASLSSSKTLEMDDFTPRKYSIRTSQSELPKIPELCEASDIIAPSKSKINDDSSVEMDSIKTNKSELPKIHESFDLSEDTIASSSSKTIDDAALNPTHLQTKNTSNQSNSIQSQQSTSLHIFFNNLKQSRFLKLFKIKQCILASSIFGIFAFLDVGFIEMFPVLAATKPEYKGMGFTTSHVGIVLMVASVAVIPLQLTVLPKINIKYGSKKAFIGSCSLLVVLWPMLPAIAYIRNRYALWTCVILLIFTIRILAFISYLSLNIIVNESVTADLRGSANGITMTIAATGRLSAPLVFGSLFSWSLKNIKGIEENRHPLGFPFNQFFMFFVLSIFSVISVFIAKKLSETDRR